MKKIFILAFSLFQISIYSQTKAMTEDGKEVVLFDNATWKFVNESDAKTLETINSNDFKYIKSKEATFLMRSKKMDMGVFVNPNKWKVTQEKLNPYMEYMFRSKDDEQLFGILITEKIKIPNLKNLKDILLTNIQKSADFFRLKESEYRTVNGLKILYLRYIANTKGLDFEYIANYYIDDSGYCGVVGFSSQSIFDTNFVQFEELLNGISIAKKEDVTEVIYSSPPPPMKPK